MIDTKKRATRRAYKGEQTVDHDLFRLLPAETLKNGSWNPDIPRWEPVLHTHFFHTVDSSGIEQTTSVSVAGHFHEMAVTQHKDAPPTVECSGPKHYVMKRTGRGLERIAEPINSDNHTHEVQYVNSERITIRQMNPEFLKYQAAVEADKITSIPGVKT